MGRIEAFGPTAFDRDCYSSIELRSTAREMLMSAEDRLKELGITLPSVAQPVANYVGAKRVGSLLFVAGHGPARDAQGNRPIGKIGGDLTLDQGYQAARLVGLNLLATVRAELGSLDRVRQIVKVLGMVNCAPGFDQTPQVINGCSDLFVEIFGEAGRHARAAVGMAELPGTIPVEIEMIVEVEA
jgi:enamine deaminase RidA (YjgF/YER057c/UK114 family)